MVRQRSKVNIFEALVMKEETKFIDHLRNKNTFFGIWTAIKNRITLKGYLPSYAV
jgi:hypothetical protein